MGKSDIKYRTYLFAVQIVKFIDKLNTRDYSVHAIVKQLVRSATSIGANIAEAQAGSSRKDFTRFYYYSLKSANETKFWLGLLRDTKKCNKDDSENLLKEVCEIANILGAIILKLKGKR